MDTLLIVGIDTVAGANLAASLSNSYRVTGLSLSIPVRIAGCETASCSVSNRDVAREWIAHIKPNRLVYCSAAARSCWEDGSTSVDERALLVDARSWIDAVAGTDCHLTLISSDAIFTGPWMFHAEESPCLCASSLAQAIRQMEHCALAHSPETLVVRTHVFGWAPGSVGPGWIEKTLSALETNRSNGLHDCFRYATPLLATDLAAILKRAWEITLSGVYHIAGAERVNPAQFIQRLAQQFRLTVPYPVRSDSLTGRPTGFGHGETSLQTRKIRHALGMGLPMLSDGLNSLLEQRWNGYRERLDSLQSQGRVA